MLYILYNSIFTRITCEKTQYSGEIIICTNHHDKSTKLDNGIQFSMELLWTDFQVFRPGRVRAKSLYVVFVLLARLLPRLRPILRAWL